MTLRAKKPEAIEKRLKLFMYGPAKVGKTTAAIQFPKPYLIDTERGAENSQYVKLLNKQGGIVFQTVDFKEIIEEVTSLLTEKHDYKTLIIDPMTTVYNNLLEESAESLMSSKNPDGTAFGAHYGKANRAMKHLYNLLLRLDMNVIITAHSKNEYGENLTILGQTFDCYKKLEYLFDLIIEIKKQGSKRIGFITGSRIETLPERENFEFSYKYIADKYGKDIIEKTVIPQKLASKEQIDELKHLIELLKVPEETCKKWMDKAQANSFEEMDEDKIQKCIDHLKSKINPPTKEEKK